MSKKSLNQTPNATKSDKVSKIFDLIKHIILCVVVIACYVSIGCVIVIYVIHYILPESVAWLTDAQKKLISDILSGGFVAYVIGKITDKF